MKHTLHLLILLLYSFGGSAQIITTVAGNGGTVLGDGGPAVNASLNGPYGVALDSHGNMFVTDGYHGRIRKINTAGIITTIAGTGVEGYNGDGIPATNAQIYRPVGITIDAANNIFFCDAFNNRVRKIDTFGIITTVAGNGMTAYNGDNIPATAAALYAPHCIVLDAAGNMYITDFENHRVRKVNAAGIISTIAGTGVLGSDGDNGPAVNAKINGPYGIALDAEGNIYFADDWANVVRKIDATGVITTFAGNDTATVLGDNGPATVAALNHPSGITIDNYRNVFISNISQQRIRKVAPNGVISTIAGTGALGFSGDNGPATAAELGSPCGITLDASNGSIYLADFSNSRVRRIGWPLRIEEQNRMSAGLNIYPNPTSGVFTCEITGQAEEPFEVSVIDMVGRTAGAYRMEAGKPQLMNMAESGMYLVRATGKAWRAEKTVVVRQ